MTHKFHQIGVAARIGQYSDAVEAAANQRWLFTSGTPGMDAAGELPADITTQAELAWGHILKMLDAAGMSVHDLVKITQYLIRAEDISRLCSGADPHAGRCAARFHADGGGGAAPAEIPAGDRGGRGPVLISPVQAPNSESRLPAAASFSNSGAGAIAYLFSPAITAARPRVSA